MISAMAFASSVLPTPAGPFDEHRLLQPVGQEHHTGDGRVGEVVGFAETRDHVVDALEPVSHRCVPVS